MFSKVLIANRGEIAVRIAQALQQMGVHTVGVFSDPDRHAPHAVATDEAYPLEGESAVDTYLRRDRIIEIAQRHGVEAIHPGYGFLSENAQFAEDCAAAGITFIGPTPHVIRVLGDKIEAKRIMKEAGVPVVPGAAGVAGSPDELKAHAQAIGYPVLIKAAAGGGGKGVRIVRSDIDLIDAADAARREATAAFGDERIFLEKYIERPRHVEVQIFGDLQGNACHVFERECSIQRRHQKIVEETPSPALSPEQREGITAAAVRAARAIGYTNAGTVEFLVDASGTFYFLEVNTRLQVEHPVTEMTTGLDLVRAQVEVAAGEPLAFTQVEIQPVGHALECRIYAEDPEAGFLPSTGSIAHYVPPWGPGIRVDSGVGVGAFVTVHYDPMLAKLVCWGRTRSEAIEKTLWCLDRFVVIGVVTNIPFLRSLIDHAEFRAGRLHTHFLEEHRIKPQAADMESAIVAAAVACELGFTGTPVQSGRESRPNDARSPWRQAAGWRIVS